MTVTPIVYADSGREFEVLTKTKGLDVLFINMPPVSPELFNDDPTSGSNLSPPLGLLYLANAISNKDFVNSYRCADFSVSEFRNLANESDLRAIVRRILTRTQADAPDVVGISLMFSSAYEFFRLTLSEAHDLWPHSKIIAGGIHASNTVEFLLSDNDCLDYVMCGEGESGFVDFLDAIYNNMPLAIKGLHSRDNVKRMGPIAFEKTDYVEDLNLDYTRHAKLLNMSKYTSDTSAFSLSKTTVSTPSFAVMTSRGCPYHCTFCASHTVHGRGMRHRSFDNVIDEVYWLYEQYGVSKIYLWDDNFVPKDKAIELFRLLGEVTIPDFEIVIQNMSINATNFEIIDAIADAKITNLAFAIESGSKATQKKIKKYVKLDKALELVRYSQQKGLNVRCFYIVGFPGETMADMKDTIEYAKFLAADWSTFSVASPIPGSEMYTEFVQLGYITDGPAAWKAATLRERLFDTKEISARDIKELAYRGNLEVNFIDNTYIRNGDYQNAEMVFSNFVKQYDFHIFGYDCLRRIYRETGQNDKEKRIVSTMIDLIKTNPRAQSFSKYFDLLDDDIQKTLNSQKGLSREKFNYGLDSGTQPFTSGLADIA